VWPKESGQPDNEEHARRSACEHGFPEEKENREREQAHERESEHRLLRAEIEAIVESRRVVGHHEQKARG
jgi:hypothetical protein